MSVIILLAGGCSDDDAPDNGASAATETSETTVAPETTTTTVVPADQFEALVALPWASAADVHPDPLAAVNAFIAWAGYENVVVGEFAQGDARSGEVEFRFEEPSSDGVNTDLFPVTTVFVRQAGPDDSWWVLGAQSDNTVVSEPRADASVGSPMRVEGVHDGFDAVVVKIYPEGESAAVFEGPVTGGGIFAVGEFSADLEWPNPGAGAGVLVFQSDADLTTMPVTFAGT